MSNDKKLWLTEVAERGAQVVDGIIDRVARDVHNSAPFGKVERKQSPEDKLLDEIRREGHPWA